jgi:hypothetical protein
MKEMMKRLGMERWLAEGAPAFWVVGISMLLCGAVLRMLSALFVWLEWHVAALIAFWAIGVLVVCFVGCGIWFVMEALTGRPTSWRRE